MIRCVFALLAVSGALSTTAVLAQTPGHAGHASHPMPAAGAEPTAATVRKVDPASGKITLAHGALKNLGMPAMTMVFKVKDPAALAGLKEGDQIRFVAEMAGSAYFASQIEKAK